MTDFSKLEMRNNMFKVVDIVLTDPLSNVPSKRRIGSSKHAVCPRREIMGFFELCLEHTALCSWTHDLGLTPVCWMELYADNSKSRDVKRNGGRAWQGCFLEASVWCEDKTIALGWGTLETSYWFYTNSDWCHLGKWAFATFLETWSTACWRFETW